MTSSNCTDCGAEVAKPKEHMIIWGPGQRDIWTSCPECGGIIKGPAAP